MEQKTKIQAEEGKQDLIITREFDLPVDLVFRAHVEPEIIGQWMGTNVVKFEGKQHGSYQFETKDPQGKVLFQANGSIHAIIPNNRLVRTFEMNAPFGVQLEIYAFEPLTDDTSRLTIHTIYESAALRDQVIKFGMAPGVNIAHNRLEEVVKKLK